MIISGNLAWVESGPWGETSAGRRVGSSWAGQKRGASELIFLLGFAVLRFAGIMRQTAGARRA